MKKISLSLLKALIVVIGIGTLALMLWFPNIEGRNAHSTLFEVYFKDPFLAFAYLASISYFMGLYQLFKVVGFAEQNRVFSPEAVKALRTLKHCAMAMIGFAAIALVVIMFNESDDRAGGVVMGLFLTACSIVVAAVAAKFERVLTPR